METAQAQEVSTTTGFAVGNDLQPVQGRHCRLLHGYLHKTSNSLCGIKGYASLIAAGPEPSPKLAKYARKIIAEVEAMERVYRSVEEMAFPRRRKLEGGALKTAVRGAVLTVCELFPRLEVRTAIDSCGHLLLPVRDLELALTELLINSVEGKHGFPNRRSVRVNLRTKRTKNGRWTLVIADDGDGMALDFIPQAATPFVTTKESHLGIGLARVDTIMDMYGLAWSLRSREGLGTVVRLEVAQTGVSGSGRE
jgi:C4-dicarboxylate-specific signal transduction histidine kinase